MIAHYKYAIGQCVTCLDGSIGMVLKQIRGQAGANYYLLNIVGEGDSVKRHVRQKDIISLSLPVEYAFDIGEAILNRYGTPGIITAVSTIEQNENPFEAEDYNRYYVEFETGKVSWWKGKDLKKNEGIKNEEPNSETTG